MIVLLGDNCTVRQAVDRVPAVLSIRCTYCDWPVQSRDVCLHSVLASWNMAELRNVLKFYCRSVKVRICC